MKNKGGRPPKYKSNKVLQKKINEYFDNICGIHFFLDDNGKPYLDKKGNPIIKENKPPTVTGLALYLGFLSRFSIYDYARKGKFSHTIKNALLYCESFAEEQLYVNPKPVGAIFALKNRGWKDRQELKHTAKIQSDISITDLRKAYQELNGQAKPE